MPVRSVGAVQRWEHSVVTLEYPSPPPHGGEVVDRAQEVVDRYGADGWELVAVTAQSMPVGPLWFERLWFKRPSA